MISKLKGPILIFGAGGFIGINLLNKLKEVRHDVVGVSSDPKKSWRLVANKIPKKNLYQCDIQNEREIIQVIRRFKPQTIFNLAAYGAYEKQSNVSSIYQTNFNATVIMLETLRQTGFSSYIHAGSQSEYGLNASAPREFDELIPNSHYAVSKTACYYLLKYYGKVLRLPVIHLRLYSVYGPWEEPTRLIATIIRKAQKGQLPPFVDPFLSRDFIHVDDVIDALIISASNIKKRHYGEVFNIATGKKTTIKELGYLSKKIFYIHTPPQFGTMKKRGWDVKNWFGNPTKMQKEFGWKAKISLEEGLRELYNREEQPRRLTKKVTSR